MAFSWSTLPSAGTKIEWKADEQLDELRDNADWLDDNAANAANNVGDDTSKDGTVNGNYDSGDNPIYDNTAKNPQYTNDDAGYDSGVESGEHTSYNHDVDNGEDNPQYGTVKSSYLTTHKVSDNAKYSDVRLKKSIIYI